VEHILDLIPVIKYYTFKIKWEPRQGKYNAGQRLVYTLICPSLLGLQIVSGIILYLLPGVAWVRGIHFIMMWLLIITVVVHIYLGAIHGWTLIKSMITGKLEESEHKTEVEA
jgi:Ni/Fe-hydrogenase 1 B-type cytochrome subunit